MAKKHGVRWWKGKVWDEFSKYIRLRDALKTTGREDILICCSCGRTYPSFGLGCAQAGHFVPGRKNAILFDERNVHGQCYNCNHTLKGNWPGYMPFMMDTYSQVVVDELLRLNKTVRKYRESELEEMRDLYKRKIEMLRGHQL